MRKLTKIFTLLIVLFLCVNSVYAEDSFYAITGSSVDPTCNHTKYTTASGKSTEDSGEYFGTCKYADSNNNPVFCLDIGMKYWGDYLHTNVNNETIEGTGLACGLEDAVSAGALTRPGNLSETITYITASEIIDQYAIQHYIWEKEDSSDSCVVSNSSTTKDTTHNTGTLNITQSSVSLTRSSVTGDYTGTISIEHSGLKSGKYTVSYSGSIIVSESNGGQKLTSGSSTSAKTLYLRVPSNSASKTSFTITVSGSYENTETTRTTVTKIIPVVRVYYRAGFDVAHDQRLGKVGYKQQSTTTTTPKTITTDLSDSVTAEVNPWGELIINKEDSKTNKKVKDAEFQLFNSDGTTPAKDIDGNEIGKKKTDASGKITMTKIPYGSYVLKETSPAPGYKVNTSTQNIQINSNTRETTVFNDEITIIPKKVDKEEDSKFVVGSQLVISKQNGDVVQRFTISNEAPEINLEAGTYVLTETYAPPEYRRFKGKYTFKIDNTGKITFVSITGDDKYTADDFVISGSTLKIYNSKVKIRMQKKDLDTDMSLVGAEIIISKEDGEEVKRFKFNDEAIDLPPGRYVLTEGEPLLGYEKLFGSCTFDLDDDGNIRIIKIVGNSNYFKTDGKVLTIYNAERRFRFTKKDLETDNKLTGSHILIQDNECNIVSEFDSEEEISEAIVLPPKYYVLTETISPEGYEPLKYRYYFQLNLSREVIIKKIELITEENNQCQPWDVSDLESEEDSDSNLDEDMEDEDDIPDKVELTEEEKNEALQYFKVDGYNITLYNKKVVVDVPDTGKNSIMYWIIGGAVLSIGILMIYLTFKKRVTQ